MSDPTQNSVSFPIHDPNDKRRLPEIISEHYGFPLSYLDHNNGKRYYAVQDWIAGVAQTEEPRVFWAKLKKRLEKAKTPLFPPCQQLPYRAANGRLYEMDYAQAETLYQIAQRMDVNTGLRNIVLKFLASAGVEMDEQRIDPDKAIDAAIEGYRRQGKSEKWIETRIQSKIQRIRFTAAFRQALRTSPSHLQYAVITDEMRMGLWKRNSATLRKQMGLNKKDNIRDHQSRLAIIYESLAEELSSVELEQNHDLEFGQAKRIVRTNAESVGKHATEESKRLGIDIATNQPLLPDHTQNA